jgi:hypothetical protein
MEHRSRRAEVRNPVLGLPLARLLLAIPIGCRLPLSILLRDLARDARGRARTSWNTRKAFMAAYWAAVAVYAGHISRVLLDRHERPLARKPFRIVQRGFPDVHAADWADASRLHDRRRDKLGLGASEFPEAVLHLGDHAIARISYNGRIWPLGEWLPGAEPIYDNRADPRP